MKQMFLRGFRAIPILAVLTAVWCIWSGAFTPLRLAEGFAFSAAALTITNRMFLTYSYQKRYTLPGFTILTYVLVLAVEIFRSGYHAIRITVKDRINVGVVDLPTEIDTPLHGALTASAITLTPGTVTIDYSPGKFKVIWIDCYTTDPQEAAEAIKGKYERVLLKQAQKPDKEASE